MHPHFPPPTFLAPHPARSALNIFFMSLSLRFKYTPKLKANGARLQKIISQIRIWL